MKGSSAFSCLNGGLRAKRKRDMTWGVPRLVVGVPPLRPRDLVPAQRAFAPTLRAAGAKRTRRLSLMLLNWPVHSGATATQGYSGPEQVRPASSVVPFGVMSILGLFTPKCEYLPPTR